MPEIGRFIQEDPDSGLNIVPKSFNSKYYYALNSPVVHSDPSGRIIPFLIAGLISGSIKALTAKSGGVLSNFASGFAIGLGASIATAAFAGVAVAGAAAFGFSSTASVVLAGALGGAIGSGAFAHYALGASGAGLFVAAPRDAVNGIDLDLLNDAGSIDADFHINEPQFRPVPHIPDISIMH